MSRTQAVLPGGPRLSDYLSIGVLAQVYPIKIGARSVGFVWSGKPSAA